MAKSTTYASSKSNPARHKSHANTKDRNAVVSLTQFAHHKSKGNKKAMEKYRNKQQSKFNRRAGLLREYKKAMKSEGYEAGVGGGRKRAAASGDEEGSTHDDGGMSTTHTAQQHTTTTSNPTTSQNHNTKSTKGKTKVDPFMKAKQKAEKSKEERMQRQKDIEDFQKQKEIKLKNRAKRSKLMSKRTKKGQPVMKNMIESMLEKIKKEV